MRISNRQNQPGARRPGITLVETVVLLACLVVVVPLLMASVGITGRPNRERMCAFRLGQLGSAMFQYTLEHDGDLPGSPGTSGAELIFDYWQAEPDEEDIPIAVTQIWDWAAPLANYLGVTLDQNRVVRTEQLRHGHYWCPSNGITAFPWSARAPGNWQPMRMVSYNSMRMMYYFEDSVPLDPALERYARVVEVGCDTQLPVGYHPQLGNIGPPSEKVFVADGARYLTVDGINDYDYAWDACCGGMYASGGPTLPEQYLRSYFRSAMYPEFATRAYRHAHGATLGLNAVHFDGHVEWISEWASRHPAKWFPSGTVIPLWDTNP
ncbi:MAG: hypothetical protein KAV82_15420, partial [Phycisphaerae bacterium]|nr:hypothetical protein [Phycisphaerae bacterium]